MDPAAPNPLLRSFERHLRAENRSDQTVATYLIALRQAEAFLAGNRGTTLAAAGGEKGRPRPPRRPKVGPRIVPDQPVPVIPDDGLRRLLAACAGKGFEDRRDTAMIMLLLDTGA